MLIRGLQQLGVMLAVTTLTVLPLANVAGAQPIPPPSADPFYVAPADLATHPNGAILNSREIVANAMIVPLPVRAWQVQYKSTDAADQPTTGMATILVPPTPWTGPGTRPLLTFQPAIDSTSTRCDASWALRGGVATTGITNAQLEIPFALGGLAVNWAVVIPDFQGPEGRFLDGRQNAHSVLDSIRATLNFAPAALSRTTPVAGLGVSGGAFATTWTAEVHPGYAPEINLTGVAAVDAPAGLANMFTRIDGGPEAGLGVVFLQAANKLYPEERIAETLLNERGRAMLAANEGLCASEILPKFLFTDLRQYTDLPDPWNAPLFQRIAAEQNPGRGTPTAPILIANSTLDELIPIEGVDALVASYCDRGVPVSYARSNVPTHTVAGQFAMPGALLYLADRVAGKPAPTTCHR